MIEQKITALKTFIREERQKRVITMENSLMSNAYASGMGKTVLATIDKFSSALDMEMDVGLSDMIQAKKLLSQQWTPYTTEGIQNDFKPSLSLMDDTSSVYHTLELPERIADGVQIALSQIVTSHALADMGHIPFEGVYQVSFMDDKKKMRHLLLFEAVGGFEFDNLKNELNGSLSP